MRRILVTDGDTRAALAAVRALGRAGYVVHVTAPRLPALAASSRYATSVAHVPALPGDPARTLSHLVAVVARWGIDVVIPVTDATMRTVLGAGENRIGTAIVAGPSRAAYDAVTDKAALLEWAQCLGLAVPRSVVAESPSGLPAAVAEIGYPCVLKPHRSVVLVGASQCAFAVRYASSAEDLESPFPECAYPVVVQERVVGVGEGVFLLMDRGRRVAAFAHRRLREKPPSGGVSVYRESIALAPDLAERCERLLNAVAWRGPAMVEFKRSLTDSVPYLMEVNGRLWGSLQLAIDAGIDFPVLAARLALGERVAPVAEYRIGVRSRWFWGDVDHLFARLRFSPERLRLSVNAPSRLQVLWEFLHLWRSGEQWEVFDLHDVRPFLQESLDWLRGRSS